MAGGRRELARLRARWSAIAIAALGGCGTPEGATGRSVGSPELLPERFRGFVADRTERFDRSGIFEFIDGAGELYLAYGFRDVVARRYRQGGREIEVALFDMGDPRDAFGILSNDPTGQRVDVGDEGLYGAGLLRFRGGRYFVRVLAGEGIEEPEEVLLALGREIAGRVGRSDEGIPAIVQRLPAEGLVERSVTYFHTDISLATLEYLGDENVLGLGRKTACVLATYETARGDARVLAVRYPEAGAARAAVDRFARACLQGTRADGEGMSGTRRGGGGAAYAACRGTVAAFALRGSDPDGARSVVRRVLGALAGGG